MTERKRTDQVGVGEDFEPLEFYVSSEFNNQYLDALDDHHARYSKFVHPGLLIYYSNVTRSPSFYLPPGMATIHAKEEVEFLNPGRVNKTFRVTWKVVETYEKRGKPYQTKETLITDEDGVAILRRRFIDTFMSGGND